MKIFWTKESLRRLSEIEKFIAGDNPAAAEEFINHLIAAAESLKENPERGRLVPELSADNIRELLYKNYRIVYSIGKNSVYILTVFEGHQLLKMKSLSGN